LLTIN